jgi:hypothetical protein
MRHMLAIRIVKIQAEVFWVVRLILGLSNDALLHDISYLSSHGKMINEC